MNAVPGLGQESDGTQPLKLADMQLQLIRFPTEFGIRRTIENQYRIASNLKHLRLDLDLSLSAAWRLHCLLARDGFADHILERRRIEHLSAVSPSKTIVHKQRPASIVEQRDRRGNSRDQIV